MIPIWEWFGLGIALMGALYTFRLVAGKIAWMFDHYPDADNIAAGIFLGACAAVVWPIALPISLLIGHGRSLRYFVVERIISSPHPRRELKEHRRA